MRSRAAQAAALFVLLSCLTHAAPRGRASGSQSPPGPAAPRQGRTDSDFETLAARAARAREGGQLQEALALYQQAITLRPDWDEGRWYFATILYELDRHAEARDAFAEVLRRQPGHAGALGLKGLCEFQLARYDRALIDLLEADKQGVSRSPGIATVVRYHAALLLTRFGDFEVANKMLVQFATEAPETPQVLEAFGLNVLRMPMLPSELPPDARERVMLAGRAGYAMASRNPAAARRALDELVARYPSTPHVHYVRGVFFIAEDPERALAEFRRELETSPSHVPARLQIVFELLKRGDATAARRYADEAVTLAPTHFAPRAALGHVLLELGDVEPAVLELEQAARLEPSSIQTHFLLARAYARAGRTADAERARAEFQRLEELARVK